MQMPVMDGIAATRAIRQTSGRSTPILAMTANAFWGIANVALMQE